MAQRHVDIDPEDEPGGITSAANAETLTNTVRITYDDTTAPNRIVLAIKRALEAIIRLEGN